MTSQLNAAEFCRRAERGLGVAIREGQERGEIKTRGQGGGPNADYERNGRTVRISSSTDDLDVPSATPYDYASKSELHGKDGGSGLYGMTDGVSDEQFEEAIAEAKAEGNLSRANVARKCRCLECRRPLYRPESVAAQRGPVCRARQAVACV